MVPPWGRHAGPIQRHPSWLVWVEQVSCPPGGLAGPALELPWLGGLVRGEAPPRPPTLARCCPLSDLLSVSRTRWTRPGTTSWR